MQRKVFISYKRGHADDFVASLYRHLISEGHEVFFDKESIQEGERWDISIHNALNSSEVLIGVMTNDFISSKEVQNEWSYAENHQAPATRTESHPESIPCRGSTARRT